MSGDKTTTKETHVWVKTYKAAERVLLFCTAVSALDTFLATSGGLAVPADFPQWLGSFVSFILGLTNLTSFGFWLVAYLALRIIHLMHQMRAVQEETKSLPEHARSIQRSARSLRNSAKRVDERALFLIERFVELKTSKARTAEGHREASRAAFEAVACNLRNWEAKIDYHHERNCDFLTEVWLRSQTAYFLEEGYDVGQRVMATNGRNLPFILLAALDALIRKRGEKKVRYVAVTPVNPKDWYNWPHGHSRNNKVYYENDFIGEYHRILREIVRTHKDTLTHGRYLLCHAESGETDEITYQPFNWLLDSFEQVKTNLKSCMLPFSIPATKKFIRGKPFRNFVHGCITQFNVPENPGKVFVPLNWEGYEAWTGSIDGDVLESLRIEAKKNHLSRAQASLKNLEKDIVRLQEDSKARVEPVLELASSIVRSIDEGTYPDELESWLLNSHGAEAHLASVAENSDSKHVEDLRRNILRALDTIDAGGGKATTIGKAFSANCHSSNESFKIARLTETRIKSWFLGGEQKAAYRESVDLDNGSSVLLDENVEPEFHLFGYEGDDGNPKWELAVTASLDYPFEVTKITLHDSLKHIEKYEAVEKRLRDSAQSLESFLKE